MKNTQKTEVVNTEETMPKVQSYRTLISKSDKEVLAEELDLKVQSAKSDLEITVATTKRDLAIARQKLSTTMSACPYSVHNEMQAHQQVRALEDGLAFAERVLSERF